MLLITIAYHYFLVAVLTNLINSWQVTSERTFIKVWLETWVQLPDSLVNHKNPGCFKRYPLNAVGHLYGRKFSYMVCSRPEYVHNLECLLFVTFHCNSSQGENSVQIFKICTEFFPCEPLQWNVTNKRHFKWNLKIWKYLHQYFYCLIIFYKENLRQKKSESDIFLQILS